MDMWRQRWATFFWSMMAHRTALTIRPAANDPITTYRKPLTVGSRLGSLDIHAACVGEKLLKPNRQTNPGSRKAIVSPKLRSRDSVSLNCEQQVETEANFAAGRLLFLQDVFLEHLRASPLTFTHIRTLSKRFGNSMTTTLWRSVECSEGLAFGLVSQHPGRTVGEEPLRYFVRSARFEKEFGDTEAMQVFQVLQSFCTGSRGPIGQSEIYITDTNGDGHVFYVEVFFNTHEALTLGAYRRQRNSTVMAG